MMDKRTEQRTTIAKRLWEQIVSSLGWIKNQAQSNPLPSILVVVSSLLLTWIVWETRKRNYLGFDEKKLWNWMELLIIPVVLAIGAWWLNKSERENELKIAKDNRKEDREIANERRNQATLEAYFDRMTELLLKEGLRESQEDDEVRTIARTRTLAVLRSLDRRRKGHLLRFLAESGLIGKDAPIISLEGADFSGAHLYVPRHLFEIGPDGSGQTGWGLNLSRVNLSGANLRDAELYGADLTEANLSYAQLTGAKLDQVKFVKANLSKAMLSRASLIVADLSEANLTMTFFWNANLTAATIDLDQIAPFQLSEETIMPNEEKYEKS